MSSFKQQIKGLLTLEDLRHQSEVIKSKFLSGSLTLLPQESFGQVYYPLVIHLVAKIKEYLKEDKQQPSLDSADNKAIGWTTQETIALLHFLFILLSKCPLQLAIPCQFQGRHPKKKDDIPAPESTSSAYSHIVPLMAALVFKMHPLAFSEVEDLLLKNLLSEDDIRVMTSIDIWCSLSRGNESSRQKHILFLNTLVHDLPEESVKKKNVSLLLKRLLSFCGEDERLFLVNKMTSQDKTSMLKFMSNEDKIRELKTMMNIIFCDDRCVVRNVVTACHFINALDNEVFETELQKGMVSKIWKFLVMQLNENKDKKTTKMLKQCLLLISVHLKTKDILTAMIRELQVHSDLILDILVKNGEKISKEASDESKEILVHSVMSVNVDCSDNVLKWCHFAQYFSEREVLEYTSIDTLKEVFQAYCSELVDEPLRKTLMGNAINEVHA